MPCELEEDARVGPKVASKDHRRKLRNHATPAESVLWRCLQRRQILGQKSRRQQGIGRYIVDFFCTECNLAIELDGAGHYDVMGQEYDEERDAFLKEEGIQVLRFENRVVFENTEGVLETIRDAIRKRLF